MTAVTHILYELLAWAVGLGLLWGGLVFASHRFGWARRFVAGVRTGITFLNSIPGRLNWTWIVANVKRWGLLVLFFAVIGAVWSGFTYFVPAFSHAHGFPVFLTEAAIKAWAAMHTYVITFIGAVGLFWLHRHNLAKGNGVAKAREATLVTLFMVLLMLGIMGYFGKGCSAVSSGFSVSNHPLIEFNRRIIMGESTKGVMGPSGSTSRRSSAGPAHTCEPLDGDSFDGAPNSWEPTRADRMAYWGETALKAAGACNGLRDPFTTYAVVVRRSGEDDASLESRRAEQEAAVDVYVKSIGRTTQKVKAVAIEPSAIPPLR